MTFQDQTHFPGLSRTWKLYPKKIQDFPRAWEPCSWQTINQYAPLMEMSSKAHTGWRFVMNRVEQVIVTTSTVTVTVTFDLWISKSNLFISAPKCIQVVNSVKFARVVDEMSSSLLLSHQAREYMWIMRSAAYGWWRHKQLAVKSDRPVVVEMTELVSKTLHVVRLQLRRVMDHVVVRRSHGSLTDGLWHQEEVIPSHQHQNHCHLHHHHEYQLMSWVIIINGDGVCRWQQPIFWQTHSPNRLVWSEGWRPPGTQSAFIKWTGWTLAMTLSRWQHHKHCRGYFYYYYIIIIISITFLLRDDQDNLTLDGRLKPCSHYV